MEMITGFLTNAVSVFGSCWSAMTANPVIGVLVGLSLLGTGAGLFARFKSAV